MIIKALIIVTARVMKTVFANLFLGLNIFTDLWGGNADSKRVVAKTRTEIICGVSIKR